MLTIPVAWVLEMTKKTSVVAALKAEPFKELLALGFTQHGGKQFRRVRGDVVQFVTPHVENRGYRTFIIQYCSMLICDRHEFISLEHGGRLPIGSTGRSYRAEPDEALARSIADITAAMPSLVQWFEACATLAGFLQTYAERVKGEHPNLVTNGPSAFTFACGYAALGDLATARVHAERAMAEAQARLAALLAQYPDESHGVREGVETCAALIESLDRGQPGPLLDKWRSETSTALDLPA